MGLSTKAALIALVVLGAFAAATTVTAAAYAWNIYNEKDPPKHKRSVEIGLLFGGFLTLVAIVAIGFLALRSSAMPSMSEFGGSSIASDI